MSSFIQRDSVIYHTFPTCSRGVDSLWSMYQWLDRAPLGRNEENGVLWLHHGQYTDTPGQVPTPSSCCQASTAAKP